MVGSSGTDGTEYHCRFSLRFEINFRIQVFHAAVSVAPDDAGHDDNGDDDDGGKEDGGRCGKP